MRHRFGHAPPGLRTVITGLSAMAERRANRLQWFYRIAIITKISCQDERL
jgi:hypothetical protein